MIKVDRDYYIEESKKIRANSSVKEWNEWSLHKQAPEDIVVRAIMCAEDGNEYMCYLYLFQKNNVTEELLETLLFVNSGLFTWDGWDEDSEKWTCNVFRECGTRKNIMPYIEDALTRQTLNKAFLSHLKELFDKEYPQRQESVKRAYKHLTECVKDLQHFIEEQQEVDNDIFNKNAKQFTEKYVDYNPKQLSMIRSVYYGGYVDAVKMARDGYMWAVRAYKNSALMLSNRISWNSIANMNTVSKVWKDKMFTAFR